MNLGATLRQARTTRKLSCEQLAGTTRIPPRLILAMEQDDWSSVPGGIFARGYLRAYAREVGLDGDALAAQYDAEHAPAPEVVEENAPAQPAASRAVVRVRIPALGEAGRWWLSGPAMAGLLLLVYLAGRWSAADGSLAQPSPTPAPVARTMATALGEPGAQPVGTSARAADATPVSASDDEPLTGDVTVTRPCWVTASVDGARTIYRLLQPGERVQARGRVLTLRVGDAGALQLWLNGKPARALGESGEVVNVRISRENYRSLLLADAR